MKGNQRNVVTFLKTVSTDFGRDQEINQRTVRHSGAKEARALGGLLPAANHGDMVAMLIKPIFRAVPLSGQPAAFP